MSGLAGLASGNANHATLAVIGGSGLYEIEGVTAHTELRVDTPYGAPSDVVVKGKLGDTTLLFLPRHGRGHRVPPHAINYRANVCALKMCGATHLLSVSAVGSMKEHIAPGDVVVPDQFIDLTKRRASTFFDEGIVAHVGFADPICSLLAGALADAADAAGAKVHRGGTYVCMEGPAFSTRAESRLYRSWGVSVIGMTAMPEAKLAREAEIPYALVALVTDHDCWRNKPPGPASQESGAAAALPPDPAVLLEEIMANLRTATENATRLIRRTLRRIAADGAMLETCPARQALRLGIWSDKSRIDPEEVRRLGPLWGRYFGASRG